LRNEFAFPERPTPLNQRGILLGVTTARHYVRQGPKLALFLGVFGTGCQFLYLARCGGPGRKMLDLLAFFDSAPFSLMARCANFPEIIEKIPSALAAPAQPASYLPSKRVHRPIRGRISSFGGGLR
jgi:hypothetical protein